MDSRPISRSTNARSARTRSKISIAVRVWPILPKAMDSSSITGFRMDRPARSRPVEGRRVVECEFMTTPFRLDGLRALVTGGASGIGEETCRVLAAAGAAVTIADIDRKRAEALSMQLPGSSVLVMDVTDEGEVNRGFAGIPHLDILINNAGIGLVGNVEETSHEDFQRLFRVTVEGLYLVTKAAMPKLLASSGSIVNIGSVAGLVGLKRRFAYCATKGAVVALSRQMALDYAGRIRVNAVCPGTVDTPF